MSCFNNCLICIGSLFAGYQLCWVVKRVEKHLRNFAAMKNDKHADFLFILQTIMNLLGKAQDPLVLNGDACNEEKLLRVTEDNQSTFGNVSYVDGKVARRMAMVAFVNNFNKSRRWRIKSKRCNSRCNKVGQLIQRLWFNALYCKGKLRRYATLCIGCIPRY